MDSEKVPLLSQNGHRKRGMETKTSVYIDRPLYQQEELHLATHYEKPHKKGLQKSIYSLTSCCKLSCLKSVLPVLQWLPEYRVKTDLMSDILAGITVAVMHIPQGMAYGILGNLHPVTGIYMAFFPVLVYFFLGTSRHVSMGTFAIICLMTGKVVNQYSTEDNSVLQTGQSNETTIEPLVHYTNYQVATTVTFTVALFQILMYVCRLGALSSLLSTTLVNGFTTGAAVHVAVSQLKDLFGLKIKRRSGLFKNGFITWEVITSLPEANHVAVIISFIAILLMAVNNEHLKPWLGKKTKIPIPIELITVSLGTLFSYLLDLNGNFDVTLVGDIPTGLPMPTLPEMSLVTKVAVDSFSIALVSYAVTMSMALIFAQKLSYEVDSNQEFLAMGAGNMFGSFFGCMPFSASLSRSLIQQVTGGVTQIASLVSCAILLILLLWVGPIFQFLPRCILASIIVVALKGIFMQARDLVKFWRLSKLDAMVWLVTFIGVVFLDIEIGLGSGVIASLIVISVQSFKPYTCLLGVVHNTDLYLDIQRYKGVEEVDSIKIFHYCGGLNFASRTLFKSELSKRIEMDPKKIILDRKRRAKMSDTPIPETESLTIKCVIIDLSALNYIDPEGVEQLRTIASEFKEIGIEMYLASASGPVYEMLQKCDLYENKRGAYYIFPTIHDAVLFAKENLNISPGVVDTNFMFTNGIKLEGELKTAYEKEPKLKAEDVANAVLFAIGTPPHVQIQDIIMRAVGENMI